MYILEKDEQRVQKFIEPANNIGKVRLIIVQLLLYVQCVKYTINIQQCVFRSVSIKWNKQFILEFINWLDTLGITNRISDWCYLIN